MTTRGILVAAFAVAAIAPASVALVVLASRSAETTSAVDVGRFQPLARPAPFTPWLVDTTTGQAYELHAGTWAIAAESVAGPAAGHAPENRAGSTKERPGMPPGFEEVQDDFGGIPVTSAQVQGHP